MSLSLGEGWTMDLERGPDWLFVHLEPGELDREGNVALADALWRLMENEFTYRMVLELDDVSLLYSALLGELVLLNRRILEHGGMLRICGLSTTNLETLRCSRLDTYLSCCESRAEALMGHVPVQPR